MPDPSKSESSTPESHAGAGNPFQDAIDLIDEARNTLKGLQEDGAVGFNIAEPAANVVEEWGKPLPTAKTASQGGRESLDSIREDLGDCTRCKLSKERNAIVFGAGNPEARLVFVGEGPGYEEDRQGLPFVGAAGELLTKIIGAMSLSRDDVYICNILKCRPPRNRDPEPDEIETCSPFLRRQLKAIDPEFICALGSFAARTLLDTQTPISRLRGRFHDYHGIRLLPTYHPAFLLRNPERKRDVWEDMKMLMREMGLKS
jgi:DNA polymerase